MARPGSEDENLLTSASPQDGTNIMTTGLRIRGIVRRLQWLSVVGCLGFALSAVDPAGAQAGTSAVVSEKVRTGGMESSSHAFPGTSVQWGRAVAIVDAPIDKVLAVVQDYGRYTEFMPKFEASRVLSQRGGSALLYAQVSVMKGAATIWAELKIKPRDVGATRVIEAKMMKGNVDVLQAVWEITPFDDGRTLVAFQIIVDPDLPLPSSLINSENAKTARMTIRALRERVTGKPAAKAS
jgi:ribosome-associated toxin RatA of RatAB toxin-antitoxin module